jgi:tRNA (guanine37-N1)-methyltransferase
MNLSTKVCQSTRLLSPPRLPGMTELVKEKFTKTLKVPVIVLDEQLNFSSLNNVRKIVKEYLLKLENFNPIKDGRIYLNPDKVSSWNDICNNEQLEELNVKQSSMVYEDVVLSYENFKADDLIKAIIPDDLEPPSSYSIIGHIIHLNLKDEVLPYKKIVAEIFLDKLKICKTVINKEHSIDNEFRNFKIDLLAGEDNYLVQTKENGVTFEFDFSKVYWNPRLSKEHERIVELLASSQLVFDVFAGVGPFAVPLAKKKKVNVMANDLNPESFKWLQHNSTKNKVTNLVKTYNKDGKDFILQEIRETLLEKLRNNEQHKNEIFSIVMNLPALAVTFLKYFHGLLSNNEDDIKSLESMRPPVCYCYCFVKGVEDPKVMAKAHVEEHFGVTLIEGENLQNINFVRNVAPNKNMMRVEIILNDKILFNKNKLKRHQDDEEHLSQLSTKKVHCDDGKYD